jgi:hypothetical protein
MNQQILAVYQISRNPLSDSQIVTCRLADRLGKSNMCNFSTFVVNMSKHITIIKFGVSNRSVERCIQNGGLRNSCIYTKRCDMGVIRRAAWKQK